MGNGTQVIGILIGIYLIDSNSMLGGRRYMFVIAALLMAFPMLIASMAVAWNWAGALIVVMVLIYGFGFQVAWGPVPWVYAAEIFSNAERDAANGLAVGVEYGANAVILFLSPFLVSWSITKSLLMFGTLNVLIATFCFFYVTETKGVPVELVPALFGGEHSQKVEAMKARV